MSNHHKRQGFSWKHDLLEVRDTPGYGRGVFPKEEIKKGTLLMVFGGYILSRDDEVELPDEIKDVGLQVEKDFVIGILNFDELSDTDYVNHSCNPNSGIKGQISLVAMRDIEKDEEITFDYGTVLFREGDAPIYELDCLCGSENCRKKLTQFDWQIKELQDRYKGFFPYYIQEEIDKLRNFQ